MVIIAHRAKHPRQSDKSVFEKKTRRRWNEHGLYGFNGFYQRCYLILDLLRIAFAPIRRGMPPARDNPWQSQRPTGANKSNNTKKSVKEQIRRIGVIRDRFWTRRASQRRASTSMGYCLPDSITSISFSNPETSSRVTLATLGIVFQTKLPTTDNQQPLYNLMIFLNSSRRKGWTSL